MRCSACGKEFGRFILDDKDLYLCDKCERELRHEAEFWESYDKVKEQTANASVSLANIVIDRVHSFKGVDKEGDTLFSWSVAKNDE